MTDASSRDGYGPFPKLEAKRVENAKRLRRNAPLILRWVAAACLARAGVILAIAGVYLAAADPLPATRFAVLAWAVCGIGFSVLAAGTLALAAAKRMPWGLSIVLALVGLAVGLAELIFAMVALALELATSVPWFLAAAWFTLSVFTVIIVSALMAWPAILRMAQNWEASTTRSRGVEPPSGLD